MKVILHAMQAWEYKDLLPDDTFDINPFDIEIENLPDGRLAYERLTDKLLRIKSTLALFDESVPNRKPKSVPDCLKPIRILSRFADPPQARPGIFPGSPGH